MRNNLHFWDKLPNLIDLLFTAPADKNIIVGGQKQLVLTQMILLILEELWFIKAAILLIICLCRLVQCFICVQLFLLIMVVMVEDQVANVCLRCLHI